MSLESLKSNVNHMKEITRELYVFSDQLSKIKDLEIKGNNSINPHEKRLLEETIFALTNQLKILNESLPGLLNMIRFYKNLNTPRLDAPIKSPTQKKEKLVQIKYKPLQEGKEVSLAIGAKFKEDFLENLSKSNLSMNQLKKKFSYSAEEVNTLDFGRANLYAKLSNRIFRNTSNKLIAEGLFRELNKNLRKVNSPFITGTYVSMMLFTGLIGLILGFFFFITLLFFDISFLYPFLSLTEQNIFMKALKFFWIIFAVPILVLFLMYVYPSTEAKSLGYKIDQELPFITIHMSAIASSGIEPIGIFKVLLRSKEYKYSMKSFRKIMNLINFHGLDLVTALKRSSRSSPSSKLRELLDGMATSITSGGDLHKYLDKRSERLLFDYKLEREKYIKASETFMNLYISIVIAAPMIFLILFVIIGGTGMLSNFIGLSINALSMLIVVGIIFLNIGFIVFLNLKQPTI